MYLYSTSIDKYFVNSIHFCIPIHFDTKVPQKGTNPVYSFLPPLTNPFFDAKSNYDCIRKAFPSEA